MYNGTNGYSLCVVNDITNGDILSNSGQKKKKNFVFIRLFIWIFVDRKKGGETNGIDFNVPEYLLPNQKDVLLTPLFTTNNKNRV